MKKFLVMEDHQHKPSYLNEKEMWEVWWNVDQFWQYEEGLSDEERENLEEQGLSFLEIFEIDTEHKQKQRYQWEINSRIGN